MIDVGDLFDIEDKYDHNYDATLGLVNKNFKLLDGCTLIQSGNNVRVFNIMFDKKIIGELEVTW